MKDQALRVNDLAGHRCWKCHPAWNRPGCWQVSPQAVRVGLEMGHIISLIISQAAPFVSEVRGATCAIPPGSLYGVISH